MPLQDHVGALLAEHFRDGAANPAGRPRDEDRAACEAQVQAVTPTSTFGFGAASISTRAL